MPDKALAPILMPKLGLTMTEGLLTSWLVKPGDEVKAGDVLFVVETEKIANEIEAPAAGRIETIVAEEGETVPVGTVVATWTGQPAGIPPPAHSPDGPADPPTGGAARTPAAPPTPSQAGVAPKSHGGGRILATPLARRLAREAGLELSEIARSGSRVRIKAADVVAARAKSATRMQAPPAPEGSRGPAPDARRVPVSNSRRIIAQRLTQSKQTIPHFYVFAQADLTRLLSLRQELNQAEEQPRVSINHFIVAAAGRALAAMPDFRVLWDDGALIQLDASDVGIAVDAPAGLIVPVLRNAGALSLDRLVREAGDLVERAREGKLVSADLLGGALSVSNVGMFGAAHLVPIINPGQTAILGVGALKPAFRPDGSGLPDLRQEVGLVLAADHRAVDGVLAARFLDRVVDQLEHPLLLLRGGSVCKTGEFLT